MPTTETNNIRIKVRNNQAIRKNQYIEIGESIGHGLNNGKYFDTEENLNEKLVFYFKKYEPKAFFITIGDILHRFNFHLMIEHLTDDELAERLKDLPDNMNEEKLVYYFAEKFKDIPAKMGEKLANSLEAHFSKIVNLPAKVYINRWHQRFTKENYDDKITLFVERDDEKMQKTKQRFLHTKKAKAALKEAKRRMPLAQPKLNGVDFDLIGNLSCEKYVEEEGDYFKHLHHTAFVYPTDAPPAIKPIFENNPNSLEWFEANFKKRNIKKIKNQIAELKEIVEEPVLKPEIKETKDEIKASININLPDSTVEMNRLLKRTQSSSAIEGRHQCSKPQCLKINPESLLNTSTLGEFLRFFDLCSRSPKSPEKEKALKKVLDEASAILAPA